MDVKNILLENECTAGTDFYFSLQVLNNDETPYSVYECSITFKDRNGNLIAQKTAAIESGTIYTTLESQYTTLGLYNVAIVEITGPDNAKFTITKYYHVVKNSISNTLSQSRLLNLYGAIKKHMPADGYYEKIKAAFQIVKADLITKNQGDSYLRGMIDTSQIEDLTLKKTLHLIFSDLSIGGGVESVFYENAKSMEEQYRTAIDNLYLVYDSTLENDHPDTERNSSSTIFCGK